MTLLNKREDIMTIKICENMRETHRDQFKKKNVLCASLLWVSLLSLCLSSLSGCNLLAGGVDSEGDKVGQSDQELKTTDLTSDSNVTNVKGDNKTIAKAELTPEGAIAQVNGTLISKESFEQLFEERARVYRLQKRPIPPRLIKTYKTSALQKLIDQTLLQQYFDQNNIVLTTEEQEAAYQTYKDRFRGEKSFQRFLKRSDKSEQSVKEQVYFDALVDKALFSFDPDSLKVNDEELKKYYEQYREKKYVEPAQVRVSHLLVAASKNAGKSTIGKQKRVAKKLYRATKKMNAQEFAQEVQKKSEDFSTRMRGGDLGYFERRGNLKFNKEFEKALANMKVGEISKPVLTPLGYHLIRLVDRQPPQVRVSHILLKKEITDKEITALKKRAQVEDFYQLAKEFSTDEMTRIRGGDLGFIHDKNPHRFGDGFKRACLKGESGEVLGPITSVKGQHLVLITQRRSERFRASHILIKLPKRPKRSQKKEALAKITKIHEELVKNKRTANSLFVRLAKKHSEDTTKDRGGDLGAFYLGGEPKISATFEEAAFKASLGKVTGPVLSPFGWHLIFAHDRKSRRERAFEEVKVEISGQLRDKRLRRAKSTLIKDLRRRGEIKRFIKL